MLEAIYTNLWISDGTSTNVHIPNRPGASVVTGIRIATALAALTCQPRSNDSLHLIAFVHFFITFKMFKKSFRDLSSVSASYGSTRPPAPFDLPDPLPEISKILDSAFWVFVGGGLTSYIVWLLLPRCWSFWGTSNITKASKRHAFGGVIDRAKDLYWRFKKGTHPTFRVLVVPSVLSSLQSYGNSF